MIEGSDVIEVTDALVMVSAEVKDAVRKASVVIYNARVVKNRLGECHNSGVNFIAQPCAPSLTPETDLVVQAYENHASSATAFRALLSLARELEIERDRRERDLATAVSDIVDMTMDLRKLKEPAATASEGFAENN